MFGKVSYSIGLKNMLYIMTTTLAGNLEVFTKEDKIQRGVRTKVAIPQNKFVAEYEANVLTEEEAEVQEERYLKEGKDLYIMQASYNGAKVIFDATYRTNSMGRLINHSKKHANILLRKPIEVRSKLRIGFIAKRDIKANEELLFDYDLKSYCSSELPDWYMERANNSNHSYYYHYYDHHHYNNLQALPKMPGPWMWCDSDKSVESYSWNKTPITIRYDVICVFILHPTVY